MQTIIFSKDRACQLECLLRSLYEYDKEEIFQPYVLFTFSDEKFGKGYNKCFRDFGDKFNIAWRKEESFRQNLLEVLDVNSKYNHPDYVMCLVDDMILRKEIDIPWEEMQAMVDMPNMSCLSLRLGANADWQYQTDSPIAMPKFIENASGNCLWWNRHSVSPAQNFNYPLSVDACIYKSKFIIPLIKQTAFNNPNQLEANLQNHNRKCSPFMSCCHESLFVNNVINVCQYEYKNKYGTKVFHSLEELNDKYLNNQVIDFMNMDLQNVRGCHVEIPLMWKRENSV